MWQVLSKKKIQQSKITILKTQKFFTMKTTRKKIKLQYRNIIILNYIQTLILKQVHKYDD